MHSARISIPLAGFTVLALAAAIAGCGGNAGPPGGPLPNNRHSEYIVTAQNGVFLGAQVNPSAVPYQQQEPELVALEKFIQRPLALHHVYRTWSELATDLTQD